LFLLTGSGQAQAFNTSKLPRSLDKKLTDGSESSRLKERVPIAPRKLLFLLSVRNLWGWKE
jgi:hypothetical protein